MYYFVVLLLSSYQRVSFSFGSSNTDTNKFVTKALDVESSFQHISPIEKVLAMI